MTVPLPPVSPSDPPPPPARRALVTLRSTVIGAVGALVAGGVAAIAMMTGLGLMEALISTGTAFTGTVTFLNNVVD
jgi:hypothetical protein